MVPEIILGPSRSLCGYCNKFKDCYTNHIQGDKRLPRPAASAVSANGWCIAIPRSPARGSRTQLYAIPQARVVSGY